MQYESAAFPIMSESLRLHPLESELACDLVCPKECAERVTQSRAQNSRCLACFCSFLKPCLWDSQLGGTSLQNGTEVSLPVGTSWTRQLPADLLKSKPRWSHLSSAQSSRITSPSVALWEIINGGDCKPLSFKVVCYTARADWYHIRASIWSQIPMSGMADTKPL